MLCLVFFFSLFVYANGTGIKYASNYGFSSTASAEENGRALQAALDGGGKIVVDKPGVYDLTKTIFIDSNTELVFVDGVIINKCADSKNNLPSYMFINRSAFNREYAENITIQGLNIDMNNLDNGQDVPKIFGLVGSVSFFYVKNLTIKDFKCIEGGNNHFVIQVCTFHNLHIENVDIQGDKDGIHLGRGSDFVIRNGRFRTYDDPIALNAHDYHISNPELGWIENGLIENCYDLDDTSTSGFFCRILAGAWPHWFKGMEIRNSDAVIADNIIYRASISGKEVKISSVKPCHIKGEKIYEDGIKWVAFQFQDITDCCGVRNVYFRDIYLQKKRKFAFSFHFDNEYYSRSYYPNCSIPVQKGIVFDGIHQQNDINELITCVTPVDTIKILNSTIGDGIVKFNDVETDGCDYGNMHVVFENVTFQSKKNMYKAIYNDYGLNVTVDFINCKVDNSTTSIVVDDNVKIGKYDIEGGHFSSIANNKVLVKNDNILLYESERECYKGIYNISGALVQKIKVYNGKNILYGLSEGIYFIVDL